MSFKKIVVDGEPKEVTDIRNKILKEFKDLKFVEDGHKYFLNGEQLPSVSEITHKFCQYPFNDTEQAMKYAENHGETAQYWLDKWKFNSLRATTTGTLVHEFGESLGWLRNGHPELITESCRTKYINDKNWLIPTRPKEEAVLKIMDNVDYYLQVNIDEILKKSLKKKKRAKKLNEVFLHGKVSAKSLEFFINDKIEEYNDDQIIADRLNNVTLEIVMDTMMVSPLYNKLLTIEWMKSHVYDFSYDRWIDKGESKSEKREIVGEEVMNAYHSLFKAENLIEQMIGVENNK